MTNPELTQTRATVSWFSSDGAPGARLTSQLEAAGYAVRDGLFADGPRPDLALFDLRNSKAPRNDARRFMDIARRAPLVAGVVMMAPPETPAVDRAALARFGDVAYTRRQYETLISMIRHRLRLASRAEETGERLKSMAAMADISGLPDFGLEDRPLSLLIAGHASPLALAALNATRDGACDISCVFSAGQVMRALDHQPFDAAIFLPDGEDDILVSLARALRRHRDFRRLPVIFIARDESELERYSASNGFDCVLEQHMRDDLARRVGVSARRTRASEAMRRFLIGQKGAPWRTPGKSLNFFAVHGARLAERSIETGKPLSLIGLSAQPRDGESVDRRTIDAASAIAMKLIGRVTRAEELPLHISRGMIAVLAPNVTEDDALAISDRILGVVTGSSNREITDQLTISSDAVTLKSNETLEELTARLILSLKASSAVQQGLR